MSTKLAVNAVDFFDRVGSTALEAGLAVYLTSPHAADVKAALTAAGIAALKYVYLKASAFNAAHTKD